MNNEETIKRDPYEVLDSLMYLKALDEHRGLETRVHERAIAKIWLLEIPEDERRFLADGGPELPGLQD